MRKKPGTQPLVNFCRTIDHFQRKAIFTCWRLSVTVIPASLVPRPPTDFISQRYIPSPPFPVCDVVLIPGLLPIFLHGCEIKSGRGLGTRLMWYIDWWFFVYTVDVWIPCLYLMHLWSMSILGKCTLHFEHDSVMKNYIRFCKICTWGYRDYKLSEHSEFPWQPLQYPTGHFWIINISISILTVWLDAIIL